VQCVVFASFMSRRIVQCVVFASFVSRHIVQCVVFASFVSGHIVQCVVFASFVSRSLYTWTELHLFFNSFCRVGLLIRYFHDRTPLPLFCNVLSYLLFNLNVCGFSRLDTPLHKFSIEMISGGAFYCCIVCASLFVR
jgi:hypothetical protein